MSFEEYKQRKLVTKTVGLDEIEGILDYIYYPYSQIIPLEPIDVIKRRYRNNSAKFEYPKDNERILDRFSYKVIQGFDILYVDKGKKKNLVLIPFFHTALIDNIRYIADKLIDDLDANIIIIDGNRCMCDNVSKTEVRSNFELLFNDPLFMAAENVVHTMCFSALVLNPVLKKLPSIKNTYYAPMFHHEIKRMQMLLDYSSPSDASITIVTAFALLNRSKFGAISYPDEFSSMKMETFNQYFVEFESDINTKYDYTKDSLIIVKNDLVVPQKNSCSYKFSDVRYLGERKHLNYMYLADEFVGILKSFL